MIVIDLARELDHLALQPYPKNDQLTGRIIDVKLNQFKIEVDKTRVGIIYDVKISVSDTECTNFHIFNFER